MVSTTAALREWCGLSSRRELDVDLSDCMDKASSVALGIALARPDRKVLVLDCDNVLRVNLGSLVTVGAAVPANMVHFLLEDGGHASTGGEPIPGLGGVDFAALARDAGYREIHLFDDLEDLVLGLEPVLGGEGPTLVVLRVVHSDELPRYPARTLSESIADVRATLGRERT